jgi:hypothetical protein
MPKLIFSGGRDLCGMFANFHPLSHFKKGDFLLSVYSRKHAGSKSILIRFIQPMLNGRTLGKRYAIHPDLRNIFWGLFKSHFMSTMKFQSLTHFGVEEANIRTLKLFCSAGSGKNFQNVTGKVNYSPTSIPICMYHAIPCTNLSADTIHWLSLTALGCKLYFILVK